MDTSSIQYKLREKDIKKASLLFGIDEMTLTQMNDRNLLNVDYIRSILIRTDYERLTSGLHWLEEAEKNYHYPEVQTALRREYGVTPKVIQKAIHGKANTLLFCNKCGVRVGKKTYTRTGGLCTNCFADTLEM